MTTEEFHNARYNGILEVMKKDREQYFKLQQNYDRLLSEFNVMKIKYLEVVNDCIDKKIQLRDEIRRLKE